MCLDASSILMMSSAVSGATGALVTILTTKGSEWLIELVAAHSPEVQRRATKNLQNFVNRLAKRVEQLEYELPAEDRGMIENAMDHPGTAFLISSAMKHSAVTDNDEHHALLAELIAQRLGAGADDMVTLAGTAGCDVVNSLSTRQINLLAILSLILDIRPLQRLRLNEGLNPSEAICDWLEEQLCPLLDRIVVESVTALDLEHLVAMRCARISSIGTDLKSILSDRFTEVKFTIDQSVIEKYQFYCQVTALWKHASGARLTSIGKLIGVLHRDSVQGTKTTISW